MASTRMHRRKPTDTVWMFFPPITLWADLDVEDPIGAAGSYADTNLATQEWLAQAKRRIALRVVESDNRLTQADFGKTQVNFGCRPGSASGKRSSRRSPHISGVVADGHEQNMPRFGRVCDTNRVWEDWHAL